MELEGYGFQMLRYSSDLKLRDLKLKDLLGWSLSALKRFKWLYTLHISFAQASDIADIVRDMKNLKLLRVDNLKSDNETEVIHILEALPSSMKYLKLGGVQLTQEIRDKIPEGIEFQT